MKDYFLKPSGGERAAYVDYLLQRLTTFRQAGAGFGQSHQGKISIHITRKIIQSQLAWPIEDETHFDETCQFIKAKIDDTILGRRNVSKGHRSYHSFAEHGQPKQSSSKTVIAPTSIKTNPVKVENCKPASLPSAFFITSPSRSPLKASSVIPQRDSSLGPLSCTTVAAALQVMSATPTANEIALLWHAAFESVETLINAGKSGKKIKRTLIRYLVEHAEFLSESPAALRRNFNRKFEHWKLNSKTAACLVDGRAEANAKRRVQLSATDRDKLIGEALFKHGGEYTPAWREMLERGELSTEVNKRYLLNPAKRSHVPAAISREIAAEVKLLLPHFHGPRQAKLNGAYIERDWSKVGAGDWYSSDDFTLEVYFYLPDGKGWFTLSRGQWLPMIDERSKRILDFVLVTDKHYTGINVRTLINKVCERYGLPRCGIHLENGIWRKSQLVGGAVPINDVRMNFANRLNIQLTHALPGNARSKVVENVGKLFQARLRGEPGWVGPNEQVLKIEHVQREKLEVESGRKHPSEMGFLSLELWVKRLAEICEQYNATPQHSKVFGTTMSPDEAWRLFQTRNESQAIVPLAKLPDSCRYLLATHIRRVRIGRNGIKLPISLGGGSYKNEITGQLQGREVNIYFDLEMPEFLSIVSDDRSQVFTVPLAPTCPAHDATPEEFAAAQAPVSAHTQYARQRISQLRSAYMPPTRVSLIDPRTSAVGHAMQAQKEKAVAAQQTRKRTQERTNKAARQAGINPAAVADGRALEKLNQALNDEP